MARPPRARLELNGTLENVQSRGTRADYIPLAMARNPAIRRNAGRRFGGTEAAGVRNRRNGDGEDE
jgi:hypothetical protein